MGVSDRSFGAGAFGPRRFPRSVYISNELSRIDDPIRGFLDSIGGSLSLNTQAAYARHLLRLDKFLQERCLITATRGDLVSYVSYLKLQKLSSATRAQCVNAVRKFYRYAIRQNLRTDNPAEFFIARRHGHQLSSNAVFKRFRIYLNCERTVCLNTQALYMRRIADLAGYLLPVHLLTAKEENLFGYLDHLRIMNVSRRSRARAVGVIQIFYRWAMVDDLRADNPSVRLERPRKDETPLSWHETVVVYRSAFLKEGVL